MKIFIALLFCLNLHAEVYIYKYTKCPLKAAELIAPLQYRDYALLSDEHKEYILEDLHKLAMKKPIKKFYSTAEIEANKQMLKFFDDYPSDALFHFQRATKDSMIDAVLLEYCYEKAEQ